MNEIAQVPEEVERCGLVVEECLTIPTKDFLVSTKKNEFSIELKKAERRLLKHYQKEYNIKSGTCLAKLLGYLVENSGLDGDFERIPYSYFYDIKGVERWSESTIRKNLKRMERLGIIEIQDADKREIRLFDILRKAVKQLTGKTYRKIITPKRTIDSSELNYDKDRFGEELVDDIIRDCTDEEIRKMRKEGRKIIERIDLRGMNEIERANAALELYHKTISKYHSLTHEERSRLIEQISSKLREYSHVKEFYLAGSMANNQDREGSDVDILVVRRYCPGRDKCLKSIKPETVDLLCYTESELRQLKERKALMSVHLVQLYQGN
jgi:predicted nucleotidyltransferase